MKEKKEQKRSAACRRRCLLFFPGWRFFPTEQCRVRCFRWPFFPSSRGGGCWSERGRNAPSCFFRPLPLFSRREKRKRPLCFFSSCMLLLLLQHDMLIPSRERGGGGVCWSFVFFSSFALGFFPLPFFAVPASEGKVRDALLLFSSQSTPPHFQSFAHRENRVRRHLIEARTPSPRCSGD